MNKYFGIGITTTIHKSLTIFVNNSMMVIRPFKLKYYYYDKTQDKPVINLFIGVTIGPIYPESIIDN